MVFSKNIKNFKTTGIRLFSSYKSILNKNKKGLKGILTNCF